MASPREKIRKNTAELRTTLTDKYENLVDCSILLTSIQDFTHQIEAIEKDISHIFHQNPLKNKQEEGRKQNSLVNRIEEKVYQRQFN